VFPDDDAAGEALGAGGADVIVAERIEHRDARESGDVGHRQQGQSDAGKDKIAQAAPLAEGRPVEFCGEPDKQQRRRHEARQAHADQRDAETEPVENPSPPHRRQRA